MSASPAQERIRSYKKRASRVTVGQQRALDAGWDRFGVAEAEAPLDFAALFGRSAPVVLEIGFGMGETTAAMAAADPGRDILAIDVHTPGVGALLNDVAARGLTNVRVATGDAVTLLEQRIGDGALAEIRVFFPDPWPKPRHHKRRLIRPDFVALAATKLALGGVLHCATDWAPYAEHMLAVIGAEVRFAVDGFTPRPPHRPVTRFELQGLAKGHEVYDVIARRR